MIDLTSADTLPLALRGGVVALGNFDGFHAGHQAVVGHAVARARTAGRPAIVATFDPHPARFFRPDAPPFTLTDMAQRTALFAAAGVDATYRIIFDAETAAVGAEAFVADWLGHRLGAAAAVTGADFTFGRDRAGTTALLASLGAEHGIAAETVPAVADTGGIISSTRIRAALRAGDPREATPLLTRPFTIRGTVIHGDKRGRQLGYPTANMALGDYCRPRYGIYAVRGALPDGRVLDGVANLGIRPSFDPPKELLEPFFFDFEGDLYGQTIDVALIDFIRPEQRFDDMAALMDQMAADCDAARAAIVSLK